MSAGKNYGIRNAGYYALRALRTEKFFAYWGSDLNPGTTPLECGREYRVKFGVSLQGWICNKHATNSFVQNSGISSALAMVTPQPYTKPSLYRGYNKGLNWIESVGEIWDECTRKRM